MTVSFFNNNDICIIPVHTRSKRPKPVACQNRTIAQNDANEFGGDTNLGVVLGTASGRLVDVDLDSQVARQLAPYFLPSTGWVFGRKSAPKSHYIYRVAAEPGPGRKFNIGDKFAEYRANGQMTVFPPSIHESGEPVEWATSDEIGQSSRSELLERLSWMAICAIVLPNYREGKRNDLVLALTGTLLRSGKSEDDTLRLVQVLTDTTGDPEKRSRFEAVRNTARRIKTGELITGRAHLAGIIGEKATTELCLYLGVSEHQDRSRPKGKVTGMLDVDDQNDSGLGAAFAGSVKSRVRFAEDAACFYVWDNQGIWRRDEQAHKVGFEFDNFILERVDQLDSLAGISNRDRESHRSFLLKYRNRSSARSAIKQSACRLSIQTGEFDSKDDVVAVRNGLLKLRDGVLTPCRPEHYITRRLDIDYDPSADCPAFRRVLSESFDGDDALVNYFTGLVGYWLTGSTDRQECYVLFGEGANGKSTIVNALSHVLGEYVETLMSETIFETQRGAHSSDLASMRGKRLGVVHEAESKFRLNAPLIKQITRGDSIKTRALYCNPVSFKAKFKMIVLCNRRPDLDAHDGALKRRIKLIPSIRSFLAKVETPSWVKSFGTRDQEF